MKTALLLLLVVSHSFAAEMLLATIIAVAPDAEHRALVVRYQVSGTAHERRLTFPEPIADFRYCRWMGDSGIAIVARTGAGDTSGYFYSAFYLSGEPFTPTPAKIPAPKGEFSVLGIGNTGGDSLVIQGARHRRNPTEAVSGWLYIDNCPITGLAFGHITPFELPAERPVPSK